MILCPSCRAPNPDSFQFCGRCGKPLQEQAPEQKPPEGEAVPSWLRELGGGLEAGTVIAEVAGVFTVGNDSQILCLRQGGKLAEQLMLAEVATVGGIGQVARIFKFVGPDDPDGKLKLPGQGQGLLKLTTGQAG